MGLNEGDLGLPQSEGTEFVRGDIWWSGVLRANDLASDICMEAGGGREYG
jgi:hypothetical protein